jgi:hypothetical protein
MVYTKTINDNMIINFDYVYVQDRKICDTRGQDLNHIWRGLPESNKI